MKRFSFLIISLGLTIISCNQRLVSGKYLYHGSYFEIHDDRYYYYSNEYNRWKFSQGKISRKGSEVNFIPDSAFFFTISVSKYYLDSNIDGRKIIIQDADSLLKKFHFTFENGSSKSVVNLENGFIIYKPVLSSYQDGSIAIKATPRDSIVVLPLPIHNSIISNTLSFFDVNNDDPNDKPWNVLILKVRISGKMFAFTTLPPYVLKDNSLVEKKFPIYKLAK